MTVADEDRELFRIGREKIRAMKLKNLEQVKKAKANLNRRFKTLNQAGRIAEGSSTELRRVEHELTIRSLPIGARVKYTGIIFSGRGKEICGKVGLLERVKEKYASVKYGELNWNIPIKQLDPVSDSASDESVAKDARVMKDLNLAVANMLKTSLG
jgi:hypothetical protein